MRRFLVATAVIGASMNIPKILVNISLALFIGSPVQALDFPFKTLGFDYEADYPCTLVVISNQPSEDQSDVGMRGFTPPPNPQDFVRYPAECIYEGQSYEGERGSPTDLQVDCRNKRMASEAWGPKTIIYDDEKKVFTSDHGWSLSVKGLNHQSYLHNNIYRPIYQAICQS